MTSISKPSKPNSSTCTRCEMMKVEDSCGLAKLQAYRKSPLNLVSQHHNQLPRNSHPCRLPLSRLHHLLPTRKDGNSPWFFATWSIPPNSPANSTRKTTGKS